MTSHPAWFAQRTPSVPAGGALPLPASFTAICVSHDHGKREGISSQTKKLPCSWDKMDGVCFICGAGPDESCVMEDERTS